tara:strand:- start:712 stop:1023 length:312 start_codon:yes stop_codon:yes gene_type:complete
MQQFLIFEAAFNFIGQILIKEYEQRLLDEQKSNIQDKIKCINQMYMYTHMLKIDHNLLQEKYQKLDLQYKKEIQALKNKLNEANDTIRFADLGSKRFTKKDDR